MGDHIKKFVFYGSTARDETCGSKSAVNISIVVDTMRMKSKLYANVNDAELKYEAIPSLQILTTKEFD